MDTTGTDDTAAFASYQSAFSEPPGYLNFASFGPPSSRVADRLADLLHTAGHASSDAMAHLQGEELRARSAFSRLTGFPLDRVGLTGSTSLGLFQVAFGLARGTVLVGAGEFPSNHYPWLRTAEAGRARIALIGEPGTQMTPDAVARSLGDDTVAVSVSAVDFRTGYRADLAGIREVIGPDRLLVVDGIQAFGVVDAAWAPADVLISGAQKWVRGAWGVAGIAMSEQALARLEPVLTGWTGVADAYRYDGEEHAPLPGAGRFSISNLSPYATGAFAEALELMESVGVAAIEGLVSTHAQALITQLDDAGVPVLSPRDRAERAGIVVAGVRGRAEEAHAALAAAGITATRHGDSRIRLSVHATTRSEALGEAAGVLAGFV
ncbi:aminotransferase class V-fold PLP-dependent enzyme [Arthrobacter agilis]|uniref:aminotransferase class V-fold PLP-dependent enzyme n=1 Tax=Arthrobacter agilis TaxID=37921 RepID=UPI000B35829A|nr:aminotransferase class V-fold PLP-dependent enzyme [Arthrobacter agilis]OUM43579.1 hypothetical protein B8W74_05230 [Arthrobacter agilis]PPB47653.1 aminotransferase class V-fold PLP-dependent enzyme [Arthrobacter agilis]TPV24826.1 aminotransferase class V-fold PLP-dependent enzyme [Arthrobacter agilis]VDR30970.1 Kynureninase [Arthrobacter agilis]